MAAAGKAGTPHSMLSVVGLSDEAVEACCKEARSRICSSIFTPARLPSIFRSYFLFDSAIEFAIELLVLNL